MSESQQSKPRRCRVCRADLKMTAREMREHFKKEHSAEERSFAERRKEHPMSIIEQAVQAKRGGAL